MTTRTDASHTESLASAPTAEPTTDPAEDDPATDDLAATGPAEDDRATDDLAATGPAEDDRATDLAPDDPAAGEAVADGPSPEGSAAPVSGGRRWVVLVVVAVLLAGLGGWFLLRAADVRSSPAAANAALVDTGRTAEVSAAVSSALNQLFSYSYDRTEDTERAAADLLRGEARETYDRLFAQVRELAPAQKLVLTTRVVSIAVQQLTDDSARLLVFLDQSATRADRDTTDAAAAQLSVTARIEGDRWVVTGMEPR